MIVTYNKQYKEKATGRGWKLYSDVKMKDTLVFHFLEAIVKDSTNLGFDELYDLIEKKYKERTMRSRCHIAKIGDCIQIGKDSVFPRFYVEKIA